MIRFHILSNNYVSKSKILGEHGLSILIEVDNKKILFDVGQRDFFLKNSKTMGLNLNDIDYIVLSHGHYDHTGGLKYLNLNDTNTTLYLHPHALHEKYSVYEGTKRYIGIPWKLDEISLKQEKVVQIKEPEYIDDGILLSGEISRSTSFEEIPSYFKVRSNNEFIQDLFNDEQMLIIETKKGMIIFVGCSHPGIVNCLKHANKLNPSKKILAVIGGMHLNNTTSYRLNKTIEYLQEADIDKIFPLHCTGINPMAEMKKVLGNRCILCGTGDTIEL